MLYYIFHIEYSDSGLKTIKKYSTNNYNENVVIINVPWRRPTAAIKEDT